MTAPDAAWREALAAPISLAELELLEVVVPQVEAFRSAVGVRAERRALLVRWHDDDGAWGIGECSCRPDPFFSGEFVDGAWTVLSEHAAPALAGVTHLGDAEHRLGRIRGWPFTIAAVLAAACDLLRRRGEADPINRYDVAPLREVPVGISLGLFDDADAAVERVGRAVAEGYRRVKMKVAPSVDLETLRAVRDAFPDLHLGFDANGSFGAADDEVLGALVELRPAMLEQPFAPDRLDLAADFKRAVPAAQICLDESITGLGTFESARRLGAIDELNLKPGRVGGPFATLRLFDACRRHGLPAWVGGMFETGIGRHANLRVAARLPAAEAHDLSPSSRYFATDVVRRPLSMSDEGTVTLDEAPVELDDETIERLTRRREVIT